MAVTKADNPATANLVDPGVADLPSNPAEALPEKDDVQKAVKAAIVTDDPQKEVKEKAKVVDLSPDSAETPSGYALKASAGISDDAKRAEAYARVKAAMRAGLIPASEFKS